MYHLSVFMSARTMRNNVIMSMKMNTDIMNITSVC